MHCPTSSIITILLFVLEASAAPSSHRSTGFIARHHRRHFRFNELQHEKQIPHIPNSIHSASRDHLYPPVSAITTQSGATTVDTSIHNVSLACLAVLDMYRSMGGHQWINQQGWDQARRPVSLNISNWYNMGCCNWFGVTCSPDGTNVIALELPKNRVRGPISDSIHSLADPQIFNIASNSLRSTLSPRPMPFRIIDLSHASLYGTISPSVFQSLIEVLLLSDNTFTGNIDVSGAVNLETLLLDTNYLSNATMGLSKGKKWKNLVMYNNMIDQPLIDLSGALELERVAFGNNRFTGSMFDVTHLTKSKDLDPRANFLSDSFPPFHLFNTPSLRLLGFEGNNFTGTIALNSSSPHLLSKNAPSKCKATTSSFLVKTYPSPFPVIRGQENAESYKCTRMRLNPKPT